jgi:hypothetical protein
MLQGGYSPIPVHYASKRPLLKAWDHLREKSLSSASIAQIASERPQLGIAVAGGFNGLVPIDFDTDDMDILREVAKAIPRPNVAKKGRRGFVGFYRAADDLPRARKFLMPKGENGKPGKVLIEVLTTGKTVLPPSIHPDTKNPYRWLRGPGMATLYSRPIGNLVPITQRHIDALALVLRPWCPAPMPAKLPKVRPGDILADERMRKYALGALRNAVANLAGMARDSGRNLQLFMSAGQLGIFMHSKVLAKGEIVPALLSACQQNGLVAEDGEAQCLRTMESGFESRFAHGPLPALGFWGRSSR